MFGFGKKRRARSEARVAAAVLLGQFNDLLQDLEENEPPDRIEVSAGIAYGWASACQICGDIHGWRRLNDAAALEALEKVAEIGKFFARQGDERVAKAIGLVIIALSAARVEVNQEPFRDMARRLDQRLLFDWIFPPDGMWPEFPTAIEDGRSLRDEIHAYARNMRPDIERIATRMDEKL